MNDSSTMPLARFLIVEGPGRDDSIADFLPGPAEIPHERLCATNLARARELLLDAPCDLVLVDYRLPDGCGLDLLEDAGTSPVVVLYDAFEADTALERGFGTSASGFICRQNETELRLMAPFIKGFLQRRENRLRIRVERQVLDHLDQVVLLMDGDCRVVFCGGDFEGILGYTREEIEEAGWWRSVLVEDGESARVLEGMGRRARGESPPLEYELLLVNPRGGPPRWFRWHEIWSPDGLLLVGRDVSRRRRAEEESRRLEARILQAQKIESLGVLAGGVAHEFNNLLMSVLGNADIALREVRRDEHLLPMLREIVQSARDATNLTDQMLDYSGNRAIKPREIRLDLLLEGSSNLLQSLLGPNVTLELDLSDAPPPIHGEPKRLRQALANLVTNASEAIGKGRGVITLRCGSIEAGPELLATSQLGERLSPGRYCFIEVCDNGPGMDESTQGKVFDPFFSTKFTGRGLGLAAVLGIVRAHAGALSLHSAPGEGSCFRMYFPPAEANAARQESLRRKQRRPSETQARPERGEILLVDDERTVREVGRAMLERMGFTVHMAEDGLAGLEAYDARAGSIQLILLDITMPRMNGIQMLDALRERGARTPVLLSSGYSEQDILHRFSHKNFAGFIQKPYDMAQLEQQVDAILSRGPEPDG